MLSGAIEANLPAMQKRHVARPKQMPRFTFCVTTKTAMMPLNMKMTVSASVDICFNKKEHKAILSADKCGGTYEPMRIELKTTVMIPDISSHSARENVKKQERRTKRMACAGEAPMR